MAYILETWDILISRTIHPDNLYHLTENEDWQESLIQDSEAEKEKLRTLLVKDFVDGARQKKMEFLVQFNQGILIRLLDKLHQYRSSPDIPDKAISVYESISSHVGYILDFIEEYFTKYFDRSEKVPSSYLLQSKEDLMLQIPHLKNMFEVNKVSTILTELIYSHFINFCIDVKAIVTYNDLLYQKELLKEILNLQKVSKEKDFQMLLEARLIYMNFNSPFYTDYLLAHINKETEKTTTSKSKIKLLDNYQREIALIYPRPSLSLFQDIPSVKETLLNGINKQLHQLNAIPENNSSPPAEEKSLIYVQFKGTEIYLFHKAFIDAGGAPGETYKSIMEKTAAYLSNKTKKGFSVESLQKNSDKVDYESKENLKRFLAKMIRNIDSY